MSHHRYHCISAPKARIIQENEQVYMIIEGKSHKLQCECTKKYCKQSKHISSRSKYKYSPQKQKKSSRKKVQNQLHAKNRMKQNYCVNFGKQSNDKNYETTNRPGFHYSFRQMPQEIQNQCTYKCSYNQRLQAENKNLRKQNKCLQDYIAILEQKCSNYQKNNNKNIHYDSNEDRSKINSLLYQQSRINFMSEYIGENQNNLINTRNSYDKMHSTKYTERP